METKKTICAEVTILQMYTQGVASFLLIPLSLTLILGRQKDGVLGIACGRSSSSCSRGCSPSRLSPPWAVARGRGRRNQNLGRVPCDVNIGGKCPCPLHSLKFIPIVRNVGVKAIIVGLPGFGGCHPIRWILAIIAA